MKQEEFMQKILPLIGGGGNAARKRFFGNELHITIKDGGMVDLNALTEMEGIETAELNRSILSITVQENYLEDRNMATDNKQIALDVLKAVGGAENITSATHCMTRLRLVLKDANIPIDAEVQKISGVLQVVRSGGQYQIVIGQNVPKVYEELCKTTGLETKAQVQENLDKPKEKVTAKSVGSNILNYLSGSMTPLIPAMIAAAMFKTVYVLLGDTMGLIDATSNLYILCDFMYDAFFYFLPIFMGYTTAKKMDVSPVLGMLLGCALIVPDFMQLATDGASFTVYGIPAAPSNYSMTILPIILTMPVFAVIYKFLKKHIPETISTLFVPFLSVAITLPFEFCLLAPLGGFLGTYIGNAILTFGDVAGFLAVAVIGATWSFLVMTGMHQVLIVFGISMIAQNGVDNLVLTGGSYATWAGFGMALGAFLAMKNKKEKSLILGYALSNFLGGIGEPALYGVGFKYKKPLVAMAIGGFFGGLYAGIMHVGTYVMGATNFLSLLQYAGGGTANLVNGIIGVVISVVVTAILTYMFCFTKEQKETGEA